MPEPEPGPPASDADARDPEPSPPCAARRERILLVGFLAYVTLLALATYAQLADNRRLLDLFDLDRYFTR